MSIRNIKNTAGDTIVEVLIAISIAGLALGISYATASQSMRRSISARERDQAVGVMESQLSTLKAIEKQIGLSSFKTTFTYAASHTSDNQLHFCVTSGSNSPILNTGVITSTSQLTIDPAQGTYYNSQCKINSSSVDFFVDIAAQQAAGKDPPDNYSINIRWSRYGGGGSINQVTVYYRF